MGLEQFAKAENPAVEIEYQLGIERIERDMGDTGNSGGGRAQSELALRQGHRMAFGIVNAHVAMLQIAALGDDHAARIERAVARERLIHIVDRNPQMMQAGLHAGLVQLRPLLEQGEIEAAVREADVARIRAPQLFHAETAAVEARERGRLRAQDGEIADARHLSQLCSDEWCAFRHQHESRRDEKPNDPRAPPQA